jgi:uncharacterized transporter YbjL
VSAVLLDGTTAAGAVLVLSLVAALGLALGALRFRGVGLGIAGVLHATVYPLTMILRVLSAQLLVTYLVR